MLDKEKIKQKIGIIRDSVSELEKMKTLSPGAFSANVRDLAAAKYFIRTSIEAMIDIGAHIIARNTFGAPSTNVEIMLILAREGVIAEGKLGVYTKMVRYRNRLTHFYGEVSVEEIHGIIQSHLSDFDSFIHGITLYLEKE